MSLSKLSQHLAFASGLLAISWFGQLPCHAQVATPAPVDEQADPHDLAKGFDASDPIDIYFMMEEAHQAYEKEDYAKSSELLQQALLDAESDEAKQKIKSVLSASLVLNQDYLDAIHVLNDVAKSKADSNLRLTRAGAYFRAGWRDAALDELRIALRLDSTNQQLRKVLADALLSSPVSSGSDSAEALRALLPLENGIAEEPRIAGAIAMAAAGAENFELAVKMQRRYLESLDADGRQRESATLARYEAKQFRPAIPFPAWDPAKLLSNKELANFAHQSMVLVRVMRDMDFPETETGVSAGTATTKHTHVGTVLSSMGTILVSSETVRMPRFDEYIQNATGSVKIVSESIEVFTMPDDSGISQSFGQAKVRGIDEASGLAILEIEHEEHFENLKHEELKSIHFMPEYRLLDPNTKNHLASHFEYSVEKGIKTNTPSLREVTADLSQISAYHDRTIAGPTMAKLSMVLGNVGPVGTPVFNQLGECVGITRKVGFNVQDRTVITPSTVCARVAAKLMADGVVHRASLPIVVSGMLTGVQEPLMGMLVQNVTSKDPIYKSLKGSTIVGVDGIPTPTWTEWLIVLERVYALGSKTVVVEICNPEAISTTCMTIPVGQ